MSKITYFISFFVLVFACFVYADEVTLNSGKVVTGEILESNDEFIKINTGDSTLTLFSFEIDSVKEDNAITDNSDKIAVEEGKSVVAESSIPGAERHSGEANLIRELLVARKYREVVEKGNKMIIDNPASASLLVAVGTAYCMLGENEKAVEYLQKSVNLAPGDARAYSFLGVAYQSLGDKKKAREAYYKYVEIMKEENPLAVKVVESLLREFPNE